MKPLFLLILLLPALAGADQPSEADLEELKDRIEALSEQQQEEASQRDDLQARLRETETRVELPEDRWPKSWWHKDDTPKYHRPV